MFSISFFVFIIGIIPKNWYSNFIKFRIIIFEIKVLILRYDSIWWRVSERISVSQFLFDVVFLIRIHFDIASPTTPTIPQK